MELTYKNEKLQNICENPKYNKELVKKYGIDVAKRLPQRIKELKAFESLNDVPVSPPPIIKSSIFYTKLYKLFLIFDFYPSFL